MNRDVFLQQIRDRSDPWDIAVVGGGATGMGIAVDAAARGYQVVLLEQSDFGKGTSSRSTKLVHGGVRYLQQGNIALVREALRERDLLLRNAPHLARRLPLVVPGYRWWDKPFYGVGLTVYDVLAGKRGIGRSRVLGAKAVLDRIPTLAGDGLRGGVLYYDGQFDDSRLLINLAQTAVEHGACVVNYVRVTGLVKNATGTVAGLRFREQETGEEGQITARSVVNATGPFCDELRQFDEPGVSPMIAPSQGVHVVLGAEFLPGDTAILVPRTPDGRVMFAIPWKQRVVVGTTDTPIPGASLEPTPLEHEVDFILETAAPYFARRPTRADVLSVFTGIRPLVKAGSTRRTASLARDHTIEVSRSGLVTITGGKWTTYRKMAEDCVDRLIAVAGLPPRPCTTADLAVHGYHAEADRYGRLGAYGADAPEIAALIEQCPELGAALDPSLGICGAEVVWAARREMACTLDDVLARRTRALVLDAKAALAMAPAASQLLAAERNRDEAWRQRQLAEFRQIASGYQVTP